MLDLAAIVRALGGESRRFDIDLLDACPSTNAELLVRAEAGAGAGTVVVARHQTAGRGRQGRSWFSTPGDSLTFSLLWRFAPGTAPAGLSLVVGLAVARAIEKVGAGGTAQAGSAARMGTTAVQLKWPNDLLKDGRKLGGILVELVPGAPHAAVIGVGLNLRVPAGMPAELVARTAALDAAIDANRLLASLLAELLDVLQTFATSGFAPLREQWLARHAFQDAPVHLLSEFAPPRKGICRGVDADGALLFEAEGRIERILSGELSLRGAP